MPTPVEEAYETMMAAEARSRAMSSAYATGAIDPWTGRSTDYSASAIKNAAAQAALVREAHVAAHRQSTERTQNMRRGVRVPKTYGSNLDNLFTPPPKKNGRRGWF